MHRPEDSGPARRRGEDDELLESAGDRWESGPSGPGGLGGADEGWAGVYVLTRAQSRQLDQACADEFGMPTILLMENAGRAVASAVLDAVEELDGPAVLVLAGPGNNGGDGLVAARHLHNSGVDVAVVVAKPLDRYTGDSGVHARILAKMGVPVFAADERAPEAAVEAALAHLGDPDLVVDAVLGTGADRPPEGTARGLIVACNELHAEGKGAAVLAIDIPSGLDADAGSPLGGDANAGGAAGTGGGSSGGVAVKADITVSLVGLKPGYLSMAAQPYIGEVVVADIGAPAELVARLGKPLEDHPHDDPSDAPMHREDVGGAARPPGQTPG